MSELFSYHIVFTNTQQDNSWYWFRQHVEDIRESIRKARETNSTFDIATHEPSNMRGFAPRAHKLLKRTLIDSRWNTNQIERMCTEVLRHQRILEGERYPLESAETGVPTELEVAYSSKDT